MVIVHPLRGVGVVTQNFAEHVARARREGWCEKPGPCPGGVYYYGGIDYGVPVGTAVVAGIDAEVYKVGYDAQGYGNYVRLRAGEWDLIYAHLSEARVKVGELVKQGEIIGLSGNTGNSTGPHLHFEARRDGQPIDPEPLIGQTTPLPTSPERELEGRIPAAGLLPMGRTLFDIKLRDGPGVAARWGNTYAPRGVVMGFTRFEVVRGEELWGCIGGYPEQWLAVYHGGRWLVELLRPVDNE